MSNGSINLPPMMPGGRSVEDAYRAFIEGGVDRPILRPVFRPPKEIPPAPPAGPGSRNLEDKLCVWAIPDEDDFGESFGGWWEIMKQLGRGIEDNGVKKLCTDIWCYEIENGICEVHPVPNGKSCQCDVGALDPEPIPGPGSTGFGGGSTGSTGSAFMDVVREIHEISGDVLLIIAGMLLRSGVRRPPGMTGRPVGRPIPKVLKPTPGPPVPTPRPTPRGVPVEVG